MVGGRAPRRDGRQAARAVTAHHHDQRGRAGARAHVARRRPASRRRAGPRRHRGRRSAAPRSRCAVDRDPERASRFGRAEPREKMKCPKCSYLSFEASERCRNCGYDFSMSTPPADDPAGDLPLFDDDRPLVSVPASPRPPLSVRRTTQDPARLRSRHAPPAPAQPPRSTELDLQFEPEPEPEIEEEPEFAVRVTTTAGAGSGTSAAPAVHADPREPAPAGPRLMAAFIDLVLLGSIDAAVIYFTLRLSGLEFAEFFALPIVPLGAFLLLLNGGYFVMFTAATGQTIGKMAAGIRVVGTAPADVIHDRVTFGRAVLRTTGYFASMLPAGLGFLPAFVGPRDHRALHDRLAETRVVRA